jgi:hypothetical protein
MTDALRPRNPLTLLALAALALLLLAMAHAQPELTNTEATNITTEAQRNAWRSRLEMLGEIKTASFTAEVNTAYVFSGAGASNTVTDPGSPAEGDVYSVMLIKDTVIVNAIEYAEFGTIIRRTYNGSAWTTWVSTPDSNVNITGGTIAGITDLAVADGGTGASTASAARANLGAVGLTGNETIAGDKTGSGQWELTGQAASTDDSVMTRSLMDDRLIYAMMHGTYNFDLDNSLWVKTTTGSGSIGNSNQSITVDTGTTTGSTAHANSTGASSGNWQLATGDGRGIVDWSKRTSLSVKIWAVSTTGSDSVIRIIAGQAYNETSATDLLSSEKGIGIKIVAGDIYAQVANGSTISNTDTGQNIPEINEIDLSIESDGAGNWTFWVNGTQAASGTGAPTGNSVARDNAICASVDNGTSSDNLRLRVTQIKTLQVP